MHFSPAPKTETLASQPSTNQMNLSNQKHPPANPTSTQVQRHSWQIFSQILSIFLLLNVKNRTTNSFFPKSGPIVFLSFFHYSHLQG